MDAKLVANCAGLLFMAFGLIFIVCLRFEVSGLESPSIPPAEGNLEFNYLEFLL
jgi:hypothetical protein